MAVGPIVRENVNTKSKYRFRTGWNTSPGERRKPLPYESLYSNLEVNPPDYPTWANNSGPFHYANTAYGRGNPSLQDIEYVCRAKLRSYVTDRIQGGLNLAEFGQTVGLLATLARGAINPLQTLGNLFNKAARKRGSRTSHKGKRAKVVKEESETWGDSLLLGDVPNAYLAFKFGVEPVMQDAYGLMEILKAGAAPYEERIKATHRALRAFSQTRGNFQWSVEEYHAVVVKTGATFSVENANIWQLNQLGLINPVSVAWEVVPLSFILNWFYPIGQFLSSATDFAGLSVKDGWTLRSDQFTGHHVYSQYPWPPMEEVGSGFVSRRTLGLLDLEPPTFVRIPMNLGQAVSAGVILIQRLGGIKSSIV